MHVERRAIFRAIAQMQVILIQYQYVTTATNLATFHVTAQTKAPNQTWSATLAVKRDTCLGTALLEVVANPEDLLLPATDVARKVILLVIAVTPAMSASGVVRVVILLVTVQNHLQQALT